MLVCTHVFAALKRRYPQAELHVLCKPFVAPLLDQDPHVDRTLTCLSEWKSRYDWVLELRGTWATFWRSFRYGPAKRSERGSVRWKNRGNQAHEVDTNFAVAQAIDSALIGEEPLVYPAQEQLDWAEARSQEWGEFALVHTGGRSPLRHWPLDRYARLCQVLHEKKGLKILLLGSPDEAELMKQIAETCGVPVLLSTDLERNSLLDTYALMLWARLFVGNESGPLQLADRASAAGAKLGLVGLFGPGVKNVFYPRSLRSRVLHEILPCHPCDQVHCVHPNDSCMMRLSEARVWAAIEEVLG
jgi:ADP-heptose:LPS heptosyltransferase